MNRPSNVDDVKYIKLNKRNFEDRLINNDSGLLICHDGSFHNAYYDLEDTVFLDDGTTVDVSELYGDMALGEVDVYAVIGQYSDNGNGSSMYKIVSYEELMEKIVEDEDYEDEEY